jgi:hypothetical protein
LDTLHRTAALGFVLLIAVAAVVILLVSAGIASADLLPGQAFSHELGLVADIGGWQRVVAMLIAAAVLVGMAGILFAEATAFGRPPPITISQGGVGDITIERESLRLLAERVGVEVPGVRRIHCDVGLGADGLSFTCHVLLAFGSTVMEVGRELQERIKASVEQFTGLAVAGMTVKVRFERGEARRLAS